MKKNLHIIDHPVLQHSLTLLRDKETEPKEFRSLMKELGRFLSYEATRDLKVSDVEIETPVARASLPIVNKYPILVSILRAGNGLLDGALETLPHSGVGFVGMFRDAESKSIVEYYFKLPKNSVGEDVLVLDPMLATGDTAVASIDKLKEVKVGKITMLCVLASPEGIEKVNLAHPDVEIYALSLEDGLNEKKYLVPGLGDAGDRIYNTN